MKIIYLLINHHNERETWLVLDHTALVSKAKQLFNTLCIYTAKKNYRITYHLGFVSCFPVLFLLSQLLVVCGVIFPPLT